MSDRKPVLRVFPNREALARGAADKIRERATLKLETADRFSLVLAGGSTPTRLYDVLGDTPYRAQIDWTRIHFFWGDERPVPPDHADSNYRIARETLLSKVTVPEGNVHRIRGELEDPQDAASRYEMEIRHYFQTEQLPGFDLVILGMGSDGHTASLFPGSDALQERQRWVVAPWVEKQRSHRITLTCPVFNQAACIMFLVQGTEKAVALREVLTAEGPSPYYPAGLIRPEGELVWYVDRDAASALEDRAGT